MKSPRNLLCAGLRVGVLLALPLWLGVSLPASSVLPLTDDDAWAQAGAVARGTVLRVESWRDPATGRIWTDTLLQVDEALKGGLPATLRLRHPGGTVGAEGEGSDLAPRFMPGEERLLFLAAQHDGTAAAMRGPVDAPVLRHRDGRAEPFAQRRLPGLRRHASAHRGSGWNFRGTPGDAAQPLTLPTAQTSPADGGVWQAASVTTSGLITDATNIPARYIGPDRDEPIPYLVDVDALPAGITQAQALEALNNALAAWTAVSSVRFKFEGLASFGVSASTVTASDGRLRFQLHDLYGDISSPTVLGVGGYGWGNGYFPGTGGYGGRVGAQEFNRMGGGYLVMKHTHVALQTLKTFEEVLCHELGHVLGLAHSSETYSETDPTKAQATMFAYVHADGRGATLGAYDPPVIQKSHPLTDTPPWVPERKLRVVNASPLPTGANVNTLSLVAYDRQSPSAALTWSTAFPEEHGLGTFVVGPTSVQFRPSLGLIPDVMADPATSYFAKIWFRVSDGVNASPWSPVNVVGIYLDQYPAGASDGLPNSWMTTYWGNPDPAAGAGRGPNDDPDGDGLTNLQEFRLGTNPLDPASRLAVTNFSLTPNQLTWGVKPYEVYQLERSTDLVTWTPTGAPVAPITTTGTLTLPADSTLPKQFLRIRHVW